MKQKGTDKEAYMLKAYVYLINIVHVQLTQKVFKHSVILIQLCALKIGSIKLLQFFCYPSNKNGFLGCFIAFMFSGCRQYTDSI